MVKSGSWLMLVEGMLVSAGCKADLGGAYSGAEFLTVSAAPVPGTAATSGGRTSCSGRLTISDQDHDSLRGTFDLPTLDVHGHFTGTVLSDGTATVMLSVTPIDVSAVASTSGGCSDGQSAKGPYSGWITESSVSLRREFVLGCAGQPLPAPPAFVVEYRIEAVR